ncbi:uncharacterized protein LOC123465231 isoform X1 [Bubalus bubalis]|uniref:uncharacterized protein LOC123465231 isoform X1 n=1 Tax=Bubalus bubalis TaxID=89462 RepID=UPI001E1B66C9|nr:uncharacterized protein LOC123465231 isoform X1 [Bubalus bubalis]
MLPKAHLTSHSTMSGSRTLGCTPRSSWISPGSDHYMAREIAQLSCFLSTAAGQERQSLPEPRFSLPGAPGDSSGGYLSTIPPQQRPDLALVSQPCAWCVFCQHFSGTRKDQACKNQVDSLLQREQTSPSLPALRLACVLNTSVEQERSSPARAKCVCPAAGLRFYLRFEFTRPLVPLATAALKKGLSAGFAEINSQNSQLSTSQWQQVNSPHTL